MGAGAAMVGGKENIRMGVWRVWGWRGAGAVRGPGAVHGIASVATGVFLVTAHGGRKWLYNKPNL